MIARLVALVACLAIAAGCGGGAGGGDLDAADAVKTDTVLMPKSYRFDPEVIEVERGTTVTWKNEDSFTHDVTIEIDTGEGPKEHTVERGDDLELTFEEAGTYDYVCRFHETDMRGKVVVT